MGKATSTQHERQPIFLDVHGNRLIGVLHLPSGSLRGPAVLINHGYAGSKVGSQRLYVEIAEELAMRGIATLRLDFRGCGDSEGVFFHATIDDLVNDAVSGFQFLEGCKAVDPGRVGILGASLGGAIAALVAQRIPTVRSLAMWAAVAVGKMWLDDWMLNHPEQVAREAICCGGVTSGSAFREQFLRLRTDQRVRELSATPLLHFEGGKDHVVLSGHAAALREARNGSTAPSQFVCLPNSDHNFLDATERRFMIAETTEWFVKTLE